MHLFFKKTFRKVFLSIYILFYFFFISYSLFYTCLADVFLDEFDENEILETATETSSLPEIFSKNVIVLDRKTKLALYEKDAYKKVPMASTTKIMTCIIALENSNLTDIVTISNKASSIHGSALGLSKNAKITMEDLLYGLMLRSGNDCAIAIAEHISGNIENFQILMNNKAKSLNLNNTNFVTPHGLDNENHYTTAYELAILTDYALGNDIFRKIVSTKEHTIYINSTPRTISNTNELLGNTPGVYGVKTGFTFNAGRCLVSSVKRNDLDIIVVVLGADTKKIRTTDSKKLIEYTYSTFSYIDTYPNISNTFNTYQKFFYENLILEKTTTIPEICLSMKENYLYPIKNTDINNIKVKIYSLNKFDFKMNKNQKIGLLTVYVNDKILYSLDILLSNDLEKNTPYYYFKYIIKNYFKSIISL